jgi:hypothetical protein
MLRFCDIDYFNNESIITNTREMQNQSALGGILNALIVSPYSLISVMKLNE